MTSAPSATSSPTQSPPFGALPRPLSDEVLQSAEEAVVANPLSAGMLQGSLPEPGVAGAGGRSVPAADRLSRLVAEKPVQSVLFAMVAGAMAAAAVKLVLRRRSP